MKLIFMTHRLCFFKLIFFEKVKMKNHTKGFVWQGGKILIPDERILLPYVKI